jgi:chromosomal replication initiation ATPase DnaA
MEKILDKKGIAIRNGHIVKYKDEIYQVKVRDRKSYFIYQNKRKTKKALSRINSSEIEVINATSAYVLNILTKNKVNPYTALGLTLNLRMDKKQEIINFILEKCNVTIEEIQSKKRTDELVYPRKVIAFVLHKKLLMDFPKIAKELNVDRTNVYYYIESFNNLKYDLKLQKFIIKIFDNEEKFLKIINS